MIRRLLAGLLLATATVHAQDAETMKRIYDNALTDGTAYENLTQLVTRYPGRLAGSENLTGALAWANGVLQDMNLDRVTEQQVMVPHWVRGTPESAAIVATGGGTDVPLTVTELGGSSSTPDGGFAAEVVQVQSLKEVDALGVSGLHGKIVFYNRPMDPTLINTARAYGLAGDQRNVGPAHAAKYGAVAALVRSLTLAHNDIPHTGVTSFPPGRDPIPAAALSIVAADRLAAALTRWPHLQVRLELHGHQLPDAPAANVLGEIRGSNFPGQVLVVGGHLDSWDIAPGANDDGSGVVQSIEVLRIFRALGIKTRHTIRCVIFVNEENGGTGRRVYAQHVRESGERHVFAMESDNGSFQPRGFTLANLQHDAAARARRWIPLFVPYGVTFFSEDAPGYDVEPLLTLGIPAGELRPDSQLYFDYHHTRVDTLDHVNPRELELGAAALASFLWLVDQHGL